MRIATILLAAGRSTGFGVADNLSAPLGSLPLGRHAAHTLMALSLDLRFVVTGPTMMEWPGFCRVNNEAPERGLSHSIALGVAAACHAGATAVLIALADMPFVSHGHFAALIEHHMCGSSMAVSSDGWRRMPPAKFSACHFAVLCSLSGDRGARHLLSEDTPVLAAQGELIDINTPEEWERAARELQTIASLGSHRSQ
ncbi:nucleotidyltransferase family protein [Novosphingobium sp. PP1Y]|uniref:nucleotidyltransferase family protein n=1 Tax=Novosphingobium sp. PP1Y TaxID=702113 RepID=UPI00081177E0|nr:nucleotidyltransferase family protein [Novosphingobium sp. PP1Y]